MPRDSSPSVPLRSRIAAGCASLVALCNIAWAAQTRFNIPAQPAPAALTTFAEQAGVSVLFPYSEISGVMSNPLIGRYSIDEGLEILLAGTGLFASVERPAQVVVVRSGRQSDAAPTERSDSAAAGERALGEIVVTARRREESLHDVPISIATLNVRDIELRSVHNISELNAFLPNVRIRGGTTSGGAEGQFVIRGIPGVTRYVDGVVQQGVEGSLINIIDVERIEVLRGPQGTLFGKNAIGGAIQYITRLPGREFGIDARVTAGSFDRADVVASVDAVLSDTMFARVTAARLRRAGYVISDVTGTRFGDQNMALARGRILWQPDPSREFLLTLEISEADELSQANVLYDVIESQRQVIEYNDRGFAFTDETHAHGERQEYRNRSSYSGPGTIWDTRSANLNLRWNLADGMQLRSISGARRFDWGSYEDLDASEYAFFEYWYYRTSRDFSQELQLLGSGPTLDWTIGAYYANQSHEGLAVRWQYEEVGSRPRSEVTLTDTADMAIFGEGTWRIDAHWSLTMGLRYTHERFRNAVFETASPRPAWQQISKDLSLGAPIGTRNSTGFDSLSPRVIVQYDASDDTMLYLSYAEGFNGGGINGGAPINDQFVAFDEEVLSQYELGIKTLLGSGRMQLNASLFDAEWDNIQVGEVLTPGQLTIRNAGSARVRGAEAHATWQATSRLTLEVAAAWLDTQYRRLDNTTTIRMDSAFAYAPVWSFALSADHVWRLESGASVRLHGDYGWMDEHVTINDFRLQKPQAAYGIANARLVYTAPDERWNLALFGTNLSDEWYQLGGFSATFGGVDQGVPSRPREFGITLGIRL